MCGSLRYENVGHTVGRLVTPYGKGDDYTIEYITEYGKAGTAPFLGHSRSENTWPNNSVPVRIYAATYTELGVEFTIPEGHYIEAALVSNKTFERFGGAGIFIRTRRATAEELKRCPHDRHPVLKSH
jgi:hypothetical protein